MADASDPWDWDTERVVQELCTENRTWKPPTNPPKLPNLEQLKVSLQENLVDGESLLGDGSSAPDFFSDIGVKASKHKETIRAAINQLRNRSSKYKLWKARQDQGGDDDDDDDTGVHDEFLARFQQIDDTDRKRKLEQERGQESDESAYNTPRASLSESPAQTPQRDATIKKRKIAPVLLDESANIDEIRNIPQGILVSEVVPGADETNLNLRGAYLGDEVLNRVDIHHFEVSGHPLSDGEFDFEFGPALCPVGIRRQRSRLVKRRLLNRQHIYRAPKSDMVRGGEDLGHNVVLPSYGESDQEYDDDTWREIQQEKKERKERLEAEANRKNPELPLGEKVAILDSIIEKLKEEWRHEKLPGLEYKAYSVWKNAQPRLKYALDQEKYNIDRLQKRLNSIRATTNTVNYSNKAEMKRLEGNLEPTVGDLEMSLWKVNLLNSSNEPKRLPRTRRPQKPRVPKEQPLDVSDGETLGSDTDLEESRLHDFIVEDEGEDDDEEMVETPYDKTAHGPHSTNSIDAQMPHDEDPEDTPIMDSDLTVDLDASMLPRDQPPAAGSIEASDRESGSVHQDIDMAEAVGSKPTAVPSASGNPNFNTAESLDLTHPAPSIIKRETPSTPRSKQGLKINSVQGKEVIDLTTPSKSNSPVILFSPKNKVLGSPINEKDLSNNEKSVLLMLDQLEGHLRSSVLMLVSQMKSEVVWTGLVLPAMHRADFPKLPSSSKEDLDIFRALHVARLFDAFLGSSPPHLKRWFAVEGGPTLEDNAKKFDEFVKFLRKLSLKYITGIVVRKPAVSVSPPKPMQAPDQVRGSSTDDELGQDAEESLDESPTKTKRKSTIVRNQQAMDLREIDQRRVKEQEERRNAMRARLAMFGDNQVSPNKTRFIINESKEADEGYIYVPDHIAGMIKDHQISGIRFMWNQVVVNTQVRQGCLLAHTMGLGKTMQIITLLITIAQSAASGDSSISSQIPKDLKESRTLVLAPAGLVNNWMDELFFWAGDANHHLGEFYKVGSEHKPHERQGIVHRWGEEGGVLVLGYDIFRILLSLESLEKILLEKPNLVVADEAHAMKNPSSKINAAAAKFKTHLRIASTGSPLANKVLEYHAMINWLAPNYLSDLREFRHDFATPIETGLSIDATRGMKRKALTRLRVLKDTIAPKVHRRTIHSLKGDLPQKTEFVISMPLTPLQRKAYEMYLSFSKSMDLKTVNALALVQMLTLLCNHPACFRHRLLQAKEESQLDIEVSASADGNAAESAAEDDPSADATPDDSGAEEGTVPLSGQLISNQLGLIRKGIDGPDHEKESWKITILKRIINESQAIGDSVLVFSQSLRTIEYLEMILKRAKLQVTCLTGKTKVTSRQQMVKDFNANGPGIMIISTTAGGLGLNITGANRVILFDFRHNPQNEQQAVGRAYRLGQNKPVAVYRFVCGGTFEEKLNNRGIFKIQLASRVVDQKNPIPKAQRLDAMFETLTEPIQQDLEPFKGKDKVLDAIISSDDGRGIRSIVMADTFEEENLEEEQLTYEEQTEASRLVQMHQDRLTGKPQVPLPPVTVGSHQTSAGVPVRPPDQAGLRPPGNHPLSLRNQTGSQHTNHQAADFHLQPRAPVSQANFRANAPGVLQDYYAYFQAQQASMGFQPPNTAGSAHPAFQSGTASPVLGVTTQIRESESTNGPLDQSALRIWTRPNVLKGELARALNRSETDDTKKAHNKMLASQISDAFNRLQSAKDINEFARAKMALVECASSPSIARYIKNGELTPQKLASMSYADYQELQAAAPDYTRRLNPKDGTISGLATAEMHKTPEGLQVGPSTQQNTVVDGVTSRQNSVSTATNEGGLGSTSAQNQESVPSTQVCANNAHSHQ